MHSAHMVTWTDPPSQVGRLHALAARRRRGAQERADQAEQQAAERRRRDDAALATLQRSAAQLNAREPHWLIWAGPASRTLWAVPLWDPGRTVILQAREVGELLVQLRQVEHEHQAAAPASATPAAGTSPSRRGGAHAPVGGDDPAAAHRRGRPRP